MSTVRFDPEVLDGAQQLLADLEDVAAACEDERRLREFRAARVALRQYRERMEADGRD